MLVIAHYILPGHRAQEAMLLLGWYRLSNMLRSCAALSTKASGMKCDGLSSGMKCDGLSCCVACAELLPISSASLGASGASKIDGRLGAACGP